MSDEPSPWTAAAAILLFFGGLGLFVWFLCASIADGTIADILGALAIGAAVGLFMSVAR